MRMLTFRGRGMCLSQLVPSTPEGPRKIGWGVDWAVWRKKHICGTDRYTAEGGGTSPAASPHHQAAFQWPWDHGAKGSSTNPKEVEKRKEKKTIYERSLLGILTYLKQTSYVKTEPDLQRVLPPVLNVDNPVARQLDHATIHAHNALRLTQSTHISMHR